MISPRYVIPALTLTGLVISGCAPTANYYVANVYREGNDLFIQRCLIDAGKNADKPDPSRCRVEQVGAMPPEVRAVAGAK